MRRVCFLGLAAAFAAAAKPSAKPNFVFILTDDQDTRLGSADAYSPLGSVEAQPTVRRRLAGEGATFDNFFVNTPICCPSRTEFFTGRYFHNVRGKEGQGCMHANTTLASDPLHALFGTMRGLGYKTGIFGKTTNDQQPMLQRLAQGRSADTIDSPLDYNDFFGLRYFHFNASTGKEAVETLSKTDPVYGTAYQTTQIGNRSVAWLEEVLGGGGGDPFFLYLGPHAPHFPAAPAPWYEEAFGAMKAPRTPNYDLASPEKVAHIAQNPAMSETLKCWEDQHFRDRWRSLLSVDDMAAAVLDVLEDHGVLDNTYIIYTSDHGYKLGQWRLATSKQHPFETDIRVPFFVRGPGVPKGASVGAVAGNVDVFPTLVDLAGGDPAALPVDGRSFAAQLRGDGGPAWRQHFLHEYESVGTYYSDHSTIWTPQGWQGCGGRPLPNSPNGTVPGSSCVEGGGVCYFVDSTASNNFRALRTINASHDTQYIEWYAGWWGDKPAPILAEYYDVQADPYQATNILSRLPPDQQRWLAQTLADYGSCRGGLCP